MCGIAGQVVLEPDRRPSAETVERMAARIDHRGPDEKGAFIDGAVAFGFRRLSIIDVASGQQPMSSDDGEVTVVFNGEIYNHHALRAELEAAGCRFRTRCDTEVLVHGYREWGSELPARLSGMFAFACFDRRSNTTLLARDRMGKKPLCYLRHDGSLWFASELKCLGAVDGWDRELDSEAIDIFLAQQFIPAPHTIYVAVRKLPAGHSLEVRRGEVSIRPYWRPSFTPKLQGSAEELAEELRDLCRVAVQSRLESEVPLGAFLSGGVDSSTVVGLMAECATEPVRTFTIGFEEGRFDERPHARRVAEYFGTDHHEFVVHPALLDDLPRILGQYDEPFGDRSAVPTWYVAREAAREITVVLTGDGADDLFAGYNRYVVGRIGRMVSALPASRRVWFERRLLELMVAPKRASWFRHRLQRFSRRHLMPLARSILIPGFYEGFDKARLYRPEFARSLAGGGMQVLSAELHAKTADLPELIDRMLAVDAEQYLAGDLLPKVDISSMAHSLEARSPFLDRDVVDFALRLSDRMRVEGTLEKAILKHAFADFLPNGIPYRKKQGFSVPVDAWLRGELAPMMRELLVERPAAIGTFARPEEVRRLVDEHVAGRRRHGGKLWLLLCFEVWFREAGRSFAA